MPNGQKAYINSTKHRNSPRWDRLSLEEQNAWESFAAEKLAQFGKLPKYK